MQILNIATACFINNNQELLIVRKKNTEAWMLPGGKLDNNETAQEALIREVQEELQITITETEIKSLGSFTEIAANEANTLVNAKVFYVTMPMGYLPAPSVEIAELNWLALQGPLPKTIAPLLRNHVIPALSNVLTTA